VFGRDKDRFRKSVETKRRPADLGLTSRKEQSTEEVERGHLKIGVKKHYGAIWLQRPSGGESGAQRATAAMLQTGSVKRTEKKKDRERDAKLRG